MDADALVRDYVRRLEDEARRVVPGQADELVSDVREHIETALAEAHQRDEVAVRTVLDRLGPPEGIVAAAAEEPTDAVRDVTVRSSDAHSAIVRVGPWLLGAVAGVVGVLAWFPLLVSHGFPTPGLPLMVPVLVLAALVLRRPGGLAFFASALGVAGALVIALALSVPLTCPAGEFASSCSGPSLAPIIVPSLGLIVVGLLMAGRVLRRS